jgi:2-dehydro-3-deoxygluconokinase
MTGTNDGAGYDLVTFGEAMVRLCPPGFGRVEAATMLEMLPGGAELNTAVGVARLGATATGPLNTGRTSLRTAWVSRLPRNPLGRYLENKAREHGVDTSHMVWDDRPDARCGTYFLEEGAAPRASSVIYDRANSACALLSPDEIDWAPIIHGARYFLVTGITPALSAGCLQATRDAMSAARDAGAKVIFDPNFRSKLWTFDRARETYLSLAPLVDIMSCSIEGLHGFYGLAGETPLEAARAGHDRFGWQAVIMTTRVDQGMWRNRVGATVVAIDGTGAAHAYTDRERDVEIVDRLGAGDAFLSGLLYGLFTGDPAHPDWARATALGGAAGALKHSIRGDFPILTAAEVEAAVETTAMRVQR